MYAKRVLCVLLVVILLTGCSSKPDGMSDKTYELGCNAVEIIEKYTTAEVDKETLKDRIHQISNAITDDAYLSVELDFIVFQIIKGEDYYDKLNAVKDHLNY